MVPRVLLLLKSPLLDAHGFAHAFTTRVGGVSEAPLDSLNFGRTLGDSPAAIEENHRRVARALGYDVERLFEVDQVHGAHVVDALPSSDPFATRALEADAVAAFAPSLAVAVRTADCLPLLLADPRSGAVAAVHAGWRGAAAGIALRAVERLRAHGAQTSELIAAIGPHIRACCFEVGPEVLDGLRAGCGIDVERPGKGDRPHADLAAAVRAQLSSVGIVHVDDTQACTCCDAARFYSYRRDAKQSGRLLSVIVARKVAVDAPKS